MMLKSLFSLLYSLVLGGCNLFGIQSEESPAYDLLENYDPVEIRSYRAYLVAQTEDSGDYDNATESSFYRLFNYISGANQVQEKIAMTAPVTQEKSETISMTAPVFQEQAKQGWIMRFVLPSKYNLSTVPEPTDSRVQVIEVPARKVAVLRFSGFLNEKTVSRKKAELLDWLHSRKIKALSAPRSAGYNPPWTIPFLRRNEVQVDIE